MFLEKQKSAGWGAQKDLKKGQVSALVPFQQQDALWLLWQLLPSLISLAYSSAWQMICKQTHIFSATSAQNYFTKQFLGGCSIASRSSWELRFDRRSASSGLSSPVFFFSLCLHWLNVGEASLCGCERWASRTLISCKLWQRQCTANTNGDGAKGLSPRKSLWKFFLMLCPPWSPHQTMCQGCLLSCNNQFV